MPTYGRGIARLYYRIVADASIEYRPVATASVQLVGFDGDLRENRATFTAHGIYPTTEAAREELEPQLRAWTYSVRLERGRYEIRFEFERADAEPWPRPSHGEVVLCVEGVSVTAMAGDVKVLITRSDYPTFPPTFRADEVTDFAIGLLDDAVTLPRHLLRIAFSTLQLYSHEYRNRDNLGRELAIDRAVLNDLATFCTYGGAPIEARKMNASQRAPLTDARREWVRSALTEIIRRHGARLAGHDPGPSYTTRMKTRRMTNPKYDRLSPRNQRTC